MKSVLCSRFGEAAEVLTLSSTPKPELVPGSGKVLVRVLACGLTPCDSRVMSGQNSLLRKPKFPYIPALDVCGIVVEMDEREGDHLCSFKVGDTVIGTWDNYGVGGMSEFALLSTDRVALMPAGVTPEEGAALVNSPVHALNAVTRADIRKGDRVLVLGGSGGVGTSVVQMLLNTQASFVACSSSAVTLMESLGAHRVVDYHHENWWEVPEFQSDPFDVIIDCAEGSTAWGRCGKVLKGGSEGGRWLALVLNHWEIPMTSWYHICGLACPLLGRMTCNGGLCCFCLAPCCNHIKPKYIIQMSEIKSEDILRIGKYYEDHKDTFKIVLHSDKAFPFTREGVVDAFTTMENRKGHGNVVVKIADWN